MPAQFTPGYTHKHPRPQAQPTRCRQHLVTSRPLASTAVFVSTALGGFVLGLIPAGIFATIVSLTFKDQVLRSTLIKASLLGGAAQGLLWIPVLIIVGFTLMVGHH